MMLSPRRPYVAPKMERATFESELVSADGAIEANFSGLSPSEAARLFSDLIAAQS